MRRDEMQEASRQRLIPMRSNTKKNFVVARTKYLASEVSTVQTIRRKHPVTATHQPLRSLLMRSDDLLHLLVTAHIDATPIVNMLRLDLQHSLHLTVHSHATSIFEHQSHWLFRSCQQNLPERENSGIEAAYRTLVQYSQFALWTLLVCRICKYASVEQSAVGICHHAANVSRAIRFGALLFRKFQALKVSSSLVVPIHAVSLVDTVDSSLSWDAHVRMGKNEFTESIVLSGSKVRRLPLNVQESCAYHCEAVD
jgi:hypothetical protein